MNHTFTAPAFFLLFLFLSIGETGAQGRKLIILSPKVGTEIDSAESAEYNLFGTVRNFHSAQFHLRDDDVLFIELRLRDTEGGYRDSSTQVSFRSLTTFAERIEYREAIQSDNHRPGTIDASLSCTDGTPVDISGVELVAVSPWIETNSVAASSSQAYRITDTLLLRTAPRSPGVGTRRSATGPDKLPLAIDKGNLHRPRFSQYDLALSMDVMSMDIGSIAPLPGDKGKSTVSVSMRLGIQLLEKPSLRLLSGWTVSVLHDVQSWSVFFLWQPVAFGTHAPLVGLGAGRINFNFTDHFYIRGAYSYPLFMVGWSLRQPMVDLFFSLPVGEVTTSFDYKTFTISPAGPAVTLMISL